jgi:hypothetical protein
VNDRNSPQNLSQQPEEGTYIEEITSTLRDLLRQVIKAREP